ncbi:MAG: hypothetical protein JOY80_03150, partial [Candidatus Dormibacteraeota bacterium]|nr:hypothetical protein [Candidatus Dormibacteraeota bacterium]
MPRTSEHRAPGGATVSEAPTLLSRLDRVAALQAILDAPGGGVAGVPAGAISLVAWWLMRRAARTVIVVTGDVESVYADCRVWDEGRSLLFPAADTPPFDRTPPSEEVTRRRLATLAALRDAGEPRLIAASPQALLRPTLAPELVQQGVTVLRRGDHAGRDEFLARLVSLGYRQESAV